MEAKWILVCLTDSILVQSELSFLAVRHSDLFLDWVTDAVPFLYVCKIAAFNIWRGVNLQQRKVVPIQSVDKRTNIFHLTAVFELTGFNCKRLFLK